MILSALIIPSSAPCGSDDATDDPAYGQVLGDVFARALQLHPRNAGLWVKAASWEFFEASSASSARALMQRALRINPTAENLWLQYFRLEFFYVEKLKGRREVLGLDEDRDKGGGGDGNGDGGAGSPVGGKSMDIPSLEEERKSEGGPSFEGVEKASGAAPSAAKEERGPRVVMNETARRFYRGAVPLAIFRAAIKAVPNSVAFRALFLRCCLEDFPKLGREVAEAVLASVAKDFPQSCEAWELRASYPLLLADWGEQVKKRGRSRRHPMAPIAQECLDIFERAVSELGDREPEIWVRYAEFVRRMVEDELDRAEEHVGKGAGGVRGRSAEFVLMLSRSLKGILVRAVSRHLDRDTGRRLGGEQGTGRTEMKLGLQELATGKVENAESLEGSRARSLETLALGLADACLALSQVSSARKALVKATERLPALPGPWLRRAALERRLESLGLDAETRAAAGNGDAATLSSSQTLRQGLRSVPIAQAGYAELWRELLAAVIMEGADRREIEGTFRAAIEACATTGGKSGEAHGEFLADYVRWCAATGGLEAAHDALRWARKSLMLAGTSAAKAYMMLVQLERTLGGSWGSAGGNGDGGGDEVDAGRRSASKRRVRELFEVRGECVGMALDS